MNEQINLTGTPGANQINAGLSAQGFSVNGVQGGLKISIYLIAPKNIQDQYRRSLLYSFGGEFQTALQDNMNKAFTGVYSKADTRMPGVAAASAAVLPSAQGQRIGLNRFSDLWTFIMIVDSDNQFTPYGDAGSLPSRMLYSGWCHDEPVNRSFGSPTFNPECVLVTAHHTTLSINRSISSFGGSGRIYTQGDYDYLDPFVASQLQVDGSPLYQLTPDAVCGSLIPDNASGGGFQMTSAPITARSSSLELPTDLNAPLVHLGCVVNGAVDTVKTQMRQDEFIQADQSSQFLNTMQGMCRLGANLTGKFVDPSKPFKLGDVMANYDKVLTLIVCDQPRDSQYELSASQGNISKRNVMTSVVTDSIPPILAELGIGDVSFRYASYQPNTSPGNFGMVNRDRGVFYLMSISTLYAGADQATLNTLWDYFQMYLRELVFPIILQNAGDFDLTVHCSMAGSCLVDLQLLDELPEQGLIETNNLLGGINSPLVGTQQELQHNGCQLFGIAQELTQAGVGNPGIITSPIVTL